MTSTDCPPDDTPIDIFPLSYLRHIRDTFKLTARECEAINRKITQMEAR